MRAQPPAPTARTFTAQAGAGNPAQAWGPTARAVQSPKGANFVLRIISLIAIVLSTHALAEDTPTPEHGERLLTAEESDKAIRTIADTFKAHPSVRAKIRAEIEDIAGKRIEEGDLLLERPGRMLRTFIKPSPKVWLLDGAKISEYVPSQKAVFVKDFSTAPKALKQIQSAVTGDLKTLESFFTIHVFSKPTAPGKPAALRLVLGKKPGASRHFHKSIQARIAEGGLFFDEIHYIPDEGDEILERFLEIKEVPKPAATDFALPAGAEIQTKTERIEE